MGVRAVTAAREGEGARARADRLTRDALAQVDATDFLLIQADARATLALAAATDEDASRLRSEAAERFEAKGAVTPPRALEP